MAKFYNNRVKTGKLAGSVFAVRFGETIERAYQPVVFNPSTPGQVQTRAKLKSLSQLSAVLAPGLGFKRLGSVSARNLFTKANFRNVTFADNTATANLANITLTGSVVGFSPITTSRSQTNAVIATVSGVSNYDKVVFVAAFKSPDGTLRLRAVASVDVSNEGAATTTIPASYSETFGVWAYGVRFNSEEARATYMDLVASPGSGSVTLDVVRQLVNSDVTLSETTYVDVTAEAKAAKKEDK